MSKLNVEIWLKTCGNAKNYLPQNSTFFVAHDVYFPGGEAPVMLQQVRACVNCIQVSWENSEVD